MIAGDGGRRGEEESDHSAHYRRSDSREGDLPDDERNDPCDEADDDRADWARAAVEGGESRSDAGNA
jgi:hypothetical protein